MILEDDNILFEDVKNSCDLIRPLEEILEEFKITNTISCAISEKCEEFFNNIRRIDVGSYEWSRYFDRFVLYNKETGVVIFYIFFERVPQFHTGYFNNRYEINLNIRINEHNYSEEIINNLISLFDLNNNQIWNTERSFDYHTDPYTTYKYMKNETQLWYTSEESH